MTGRGPAWLKVAEVAALVGRHEQTIRRWIREGALPVERTPGGHLRVPRRALVRLLVHNNLTFDRTDLVRWLRGTE